MPTYLPTVLLIFGSLIILAWRMLFQEYFEFVDFIILHYLSIPAILLLTATAVMYRYFLLDKRVKLIIIDVVVGTLFLLINWFLLDFKHYH